MLMNAQVDKKTEEIIKAFQDLAGRGDYSYQKTEERKFQEPIPPEVAQHIDTKDERAAGISVLVSMSYTSMTGNYKDRDVLIRRIVKSKGEYFIDGLAMDIKLPRLIKVSNIQQIRDVGTGHIYTNPAEFVERRLGVPLPNGERSCSSSLSDFCRVIERAGAAMTVLMFLSGVDGIRSPAERSKIVEHVRSRTKDLKYSDSELNEYLVSLSPDLESFKLALQKVLSKDKTVVQSVVQAVLSVITADGLISDKERAFMARLMSILEQEGFELELPS